MKKHYGRRFAVLMLGMFISAFGLGLTVKADIGYEPWSVIQHGLDLTVPGMTFGGAAAVIGIIAVIIGLSLGEPIGVGTLGNVFIMSAFVEFFVSSDLLPVQTELIPGIIELLIGMELLVIGTWMYMSTELGASPRDAMTVALARKLGVSVGLVRSSLELLMIVSGWLLGGSVGIGTVISAVGVGFLMNLNFKLLHFNAVGLKNESVTETIRAFAGKKA